MGRLSVAEAGERVEEMLEAAIKVKLLASVMYSDNPVKQAAFDRIKENIEKIIDDVEMLK